jgi:hypothetical protein
MNKLADATLLDNRIFINSKKGTESVAVLSEPIFELKIDSSPELLGEKVRICIESYQPGKERFSRADWRKVNDPLIKLSGEKSKISFFSKIKYVPISLNEDKLTFYPRNNCGWKIGFKKTIHSNIELEFMKASNKEIGLALLKAFELSKIEI